MLHRLINHSPDLKKLWDDGHELEIRDGYLLVHHIPYLNSQKEIKYGILVSILDLAGDQTHRPKNHVVYFIGEAPCHKNGSKFVEIINNSNGQELTKSIKVNHLFSSKPKKGYADYYEKMTTYINLISTPAKSIDDSVTEKTFRIIEPEDTESVFNYFDTNSSRAEISKISQKLLNQKIAIIGLGGTGSYVLDFISKCPIAEIHIFDGDILLTHNAFRAPSAISINKLKERIKKVDYYYEIYSKMHRYITPHDCYLNDKNINILENFDFVFICIDNGKSKKLIFDYLLNQKIKFIDVGMGIQNVDNKLTGVLRVTTSTEEKVDHLNNRISFTNNIENEYKSNIQIAELNAMNATLAVIKWKKIFGFYHDFEREYHSTYTIDTNLLTSDDYEA